MNEDRTLTKIKTIDLDKEIMSVEEIIKFYDRLGEYNNVTYDFVLNYSEYMNRKKDYGTGDEISMNEAHVLTDIADNPGITVTELAKIWCKTTSALSQTVRKLIKRDFIYRVNSTEDAKVFMLYPTEAAKEFNIAHKRYDVINTIEMQKNLMKKFTEDDMDLFRDILKEYTRLLIEKKNDGQKDETMEENI